MQCIAVHLFYLSLALVDCGKATAAGVGAKFEQGLALTGLCAS